MRETLHHLGYDGPAREAAIQKMLQTPSFRGIRLTEAESAELLKPRRKR
jgi:hypothetical protein